jgi:hypothetical protein
VHQATRAKVLREAHTQDSKYVGESGEIEARRTRLTEEESINRQMASDPRAYGRQVNYTRMYQVHTSTYIGSKRERESKRRLLVRYARVMNVISC